MTPAESTAMPSGRLPAISATVVSPPAGVHLRMAWLPVPATKRAPRCPPRWRRMKQCAGDGNREFARGGACECGDCRDSAT